MSLIIFVAGMVYACILYEIERRWAVNETTKVENKEGKEATITSNSAGVVRQKKSNKKR